MSTERPTLDQVSASIGNESWLAAFALLALSDELAADAARWCRWDDDERPDIDWDGWTADVETGKRGWSSTERRLFDLIRALADRTPVQLVGVLDALGSWEAPALAVLVDWASGGNNRDLPGRLTTAARLRAV